MEISFFHAFQKQTFFDRIVESDSVFASINRFFPYVIALFFISVSLCEADKNRDEVIINIIVV